jgi:hypothetical protein
VTRRELLQRVALGVGALLCLGIAIALGALAVDAARWSRSLDGSDVRFRSAPADERLWKVDALVPFAAARNALGVDDDVDFREALRSLRLSGLDDAVVSDPDLAIRRNLAQTQLEGVVAADPESQRRSRAAGALGVLGLARFVYETQEREALLSETISNLALAIELDPQNDDAKFNLELAYQRGRGLELTEASGGANPAPGGQGSKGAGAGQPGSGY